MCCSDGCSSGLFLLLLAASVVGLVLGMWWRKERPRNVPLWILSASLAIGIATRLILFAVIDTTQYLVDPRYHYPTRLFLLALAAIGTVHIVQLSETTSRVRRRLRGRGRPDRQRAAPRRLVG